MATKKEKFLEKLMENSPKDIKRDKGKKEMKVEEKEYKKKC